MAERLARLLDRFRRCGYALFLIWIGCFIVSGVLVLILTPYGYDVRSPWPALFFPLLFLGAYLLFSVLVLKPETRAAWAEVITLFVIGIPVSNLLWVHANMLFYLYERASRS